MKLPDPYPEADIWFQRIAAAPTLAEAEQLIADELYPFLTEEDRHNICNTPKSELRWSFHRNFAMFIRNRYFHSGPMLGRKKHSCGGDIIADGASNEVVEIIWNRLRRENGGRPYAGEVFDPESLGVAEREELLARATAGDPQAMLEQAMCLVHDFANVGYRDSLDEAECEKRRDDLFGDALRWLQKSESCGGYPRAEYFIGLLQLSFWKLLEKEYLDSRTRREPELNLASCRKSALEWLQRAAADGIVTAHVDIVLLQEESEAFVVNGSWELRGRAKAIFKELNGKSPQYVSAARHYLAACGAGDDFARHELEEMDAKGRLSKDESAEFKRLMEKWESIAAYAPSGTVEKRFSVNMFVNDHFVKEVFSLESHRKQKMLFEPFNSYDPQYAPPEVSALFVPRKKGMDGGNWLT